jgi:Putative 2OG-Fe(II) oxygenase
MLTTLSYESKSFFLPKYCVDLWKCKLDKELTKRLAEIVLLEEPRVLASTTKPSFEQGETWLTGRMWQYNVLDWDYPEIKQFQEWIVEQYKQYCIAVGTTPADKLYCHSWANIILNDGRRITEHNHAHANTGGPGGDYSSTIENSYVSGHISLQAENTKTYYRNPYIEIYKGIPNVAGDMWLFPSYIDHKTDKNKSDIPRISVAFDFITKDVYNKIGNKFFKQVI